MILSEFGLTSKVVFLNWFWASWVYYFVTSIDNFQEISIQLKVSVKKFKKGSCTWEAFMAPGGSIAMSLEEDLGPAKNLFASAS